MSRTCAITLGLGILLTGCAFARREGTRDPFRNPLFTERYYEELVESMVNLSLYHHPLLKEPKKQNAVDRARRTALQRSMEAEKTQHEGMRGAFIPMEEYTKGIALLVGEYLYFSTDFVATPGPSLHLYLSTVVDPRDDSFPDATAIDLGPLQNPYGAQEYRVSLRENLPLYRTVALWDTSLEYLHSFAQLSK